MKRGHKKLRSAIVVAGGRTSTVGEIADDPERRAAALAECEAVIAEPTTDGVGLMKARWLKATLELLGEPSGRPTPHPTTGD